MGAGLFIPLLLAAASLGLAHRDSHHDEDEVALAFEGEESGQKPAGFYFDTTHDRPDGQWTIIADPSAGPDKPNKVLAQLDRTKDGKRHALAVLERRKFEHLRVSARIRLVEGDLEQAAGIFWRYRNSENHYLCRLSVTDRNVRVYRVVNGNRIKFAGQEDVPLQSGRWYTLRVEHKGRKIKVYLDDEMIFDARDDRFDDGGRIGVWIQADTVAHFDDLRAEEFRRRD